MGQPSAARKLMHSAARAATQFATLLFAVRKTNSSRIRAARRSPHQPHSSISEGSIQPRMPEPPRFSSSGVPAEEVSEAHRPRTDSGRRSTRDLESRSSSMERARLRRRPPYARRSPGRTELCHQSQAVPAAALPPSKRRSSYIQHKSILEPLPALRRYRPLPAQRPPPSNSEELREVKSRHGRAPP